MRTLKLLSLVISLGLFIPRLAQAVPYSITYAARLTDSSGVALTGTYNVRVRFYNQQSGGTQLVAGKQTSGACTGSNYITSPLADSYQVSLTSGAFSRVIYFCQSDFNTLFPDSTTTPWIEVQSAPSSDTSFSGGSVVTYPRQQFTVVPYALKVPVDGSTMTYDASGNLKVGTVPSYQIDGTISSSNLPAISTLSGTLSSGQLPSSLSPTSVSTSTIQITGGTPGAGKVLTSDASGNATWQTASGGAPVPQVGISPSAVAANKRVDLSWTASSLAATYNIYYATSQAGPWTKAGNTASATYTVNNLTNHTAYFFAVTPVNSSGVEGTYTSVVSSTPQTNQAIVSGGSITSSGNFNYHTFTSSGTLTISNGPLVAEILVVGGGGSRGAWWINAAGGGGGVLLQNERTLNNGSYSVIVGAGATSAQATGGSSSIDGLVATGGLRANAGPFGYGGGSGGSSGYPTSTSTTVGNGGGGGTVNGDDSSGGGGGGAGGVGGNADWNGGSGGSGGSGRVVWGTEYGKGGNGGGRGGSIIPNRGMGANGDSGEAGGSGVVIIRYER